MDLWAKMLHASIYVIPVVILLVVIGGMMRGPKREHDLETMLKKGRTLGGMDEKQSDETQTKIRKDFVG